MLDYRLTKQELAELGQAHRQTRNIREAYRLNAVILLGRGRTVADVADALRIDPDTVRDYFQRFKRGGLDERRRMNYVGSEALLDREQLAELDAHVRTTVYSTAAAVARWVTTTFGVPFTVSGMTAMLRRLGYPDKKPKLIPGQADAARQEPHVAANRQRKENQAEGDVTVCMDAAHWLHHPVWRGGWIKRSTTVHLKRNMGRQRLNSNGAINSETMAAQIRFDETIHAVSTVALLEQIAAASPAAKKLTVILDNARYYRSQVVAAYWQNSRIELKFLPPYSPNLILIERIWKFFKKQVRYNQYYETFSQFKSACEGLCDDLASYHKQLRSLLTENFEIIRN
jgi:transposase